MSGKPKAFLMHRDDYPGHGTTEWWKTEDGNIFYVDFNSNIRETTALPYDMEHDRMVSWGELGTWHRDMTGGKAMREMGYEPVEEAEHGGR